MSVTKERRNHIDLRGGCVCVRVRVRAGDLVMTYHIVVSDEVLEGKCCCEANLGLNGVGFGSDNFEKL